MFSIFTHMIYYVYSLSHKGSVFYIGISSQPSIRYSQHACCTDSCTAGFIHAMRINHSLPDLNIIYVGDKCTAQMFERCLINWHASLNNKLCNYEHNPVPNRLIITFDWNNRTKYKRLEYNKRIRKYCNEKKKEYESNRYLSVDYPAING